MALNSPNFDLFRYGILFIDIILIFMTNIVFNIFISLKICKGWRPFYSLIFMWNRTISSNNDIKLRLNRCILSIEWVCNCLMRDQINRNTLFYLCRMGNRLFTKLFFNVVFMGWLIYLLMFKVCMLLLFRLIIVKTFTCLDILFLDGLFSRETWIYWREGNNVIMR